MAEALTAATSIQDSLANDNRDLADGRKVHFRIRVNVGEVIVDQDDIYGDGVNVAARLEALADPSGICISDAVRSCTSNHQLRKKCELVHIVHPLPKFSCAKSHSPGIVDKLIIRQA